MRDTGYYLHSLLANLACLDQPQHRRHPLPLRPQQCFCSHLAKSHQQQRWWLLCTTCLLLLSSGEPHMLVSPSLWDFCKLTPAGTLIGRAVSPVSPGQGSNVHSDFLLKKLSLALSFFSVVLCIWTAGDYSQKEGISNTQLSHLQHIFILHPSCTLSLHYLHGISKWKGLEMSLAGPDTEAGLF